jgi:hypothetical protein
MKIIKKLLIMLAVELVHDFVFADNLTSDPNLRVVRQGDYTFTCIWTNHTVIYPHHNEFWRGAWEEGANGWRTQLRVYPETNTEFVQGHIHPVSTNLMLIVEWGSPVKNSGGGYYMSPNGKFVRFELLDAHGKEVSPNPNAGTNLLVRTADTYDSGLKLYGTNLPSWVAPLSGALAADFPKFIPANAYPQYFPINISTNAYSQYKAYGMVGKIESWTNRPPFWVALLKLDEIYSVTNEGDYTLTVQPVLYKQRIGTNVLDRVDLPSVTTKVHLVPNGK